MNRNMILPATIAAGLHAMLLGFKPSKPTPPPPDQTEIAKWVPAPMPVLEDDTPPVDRRDLKPTDDNLPPPDVPRRADIPHMTPETPEGPVIEVRYLPDTPGRNTPFIPDGVGSGSDGSKFTGIIRSGELDNHPRALVRTSPNRPLGLNDSDARVTVEFIVGKDGRVLNAHVVTSSNRLLEEPCLCAVRMWRFEPGMKRKLPVAFRMSQEFLFNTHD